MVVLPAVPQPGAKVLHVLLPGAEGRKITEALSPAADKAELLALHGIVFTAVLSLAGSALFLPHECVPDGFD